MRILLSILFVCISGSAYAHEFWIAPLKHQIFPGDRLSAHFVVGQNFNGSKSAYVPRRTTQTLIQKNGNVRPYQGTVGDRPAMQLEPSNGLIVLAHETRDDTLTYRDWAKFVNFVEHKDFKGALERHAERGLPETGFTETYRRYAKSLVAVGPGTGSDQRLGLDIEFVALTNPYAQTDGKVRVQLWKSNSPLQDAQVEVYEKAPDGTVAITLLRSSADGIATIKVKPGHAYMVDHVVLEERDPLGTSGAAWHSMWANLTFAVPN